MTDASFTPLRPAAATADDDAGQRGGRRDSLFLAARMSVGVDGTWGAPFDIRVRNLSEGGMMAEGAPPLAIGAAVSVELRGLGPVAGRIAWYAEERAGVAFDAAIDPKRARKPVGAPPRRPG